MALILRYVGTTQIVRLTKESGYKLDDRRGAIEDKRGQREDRTYKIEGRG